MSSPFRASLSYVPKTPFGLSPSKPCLSSSPPANKNSPSTSSGRTVWAVCALLLTLLLPACDREERDPRGQPLPESAATSARDPRSDDYGNNAFQIAQGHRLYTWMNCVGCHAMGGGGMGPPLMDDEWRYGGSTEEIVATILEGRPNGMPSFAGRITEQQAWQLAAYVRSLSAQPRQDALAGRTDDISGPEPPTLSEREAVREENHADLPVDERD